MRYVTLALVAGLLAACVPAEEETSGAGDYLTNCAVCHGPKGKGDGPMATELAKKPADLTGLARRAGGDFPTTRVMAKIWGYAGSADRGTIMPNFGPLLESTMVPYDGGDGIQTPTPIRLVQIAEHLKALQN